jgi:alpha-tubulin suppressor-like RCC1 family protein
MFTVVIFTPFFLLVIEFHLMLENGLYPFGYGSSGQLGLGNTESVSLPVHAITEMKNEKIKIVACGGEFTIVVTGKFNFLIN